MRPSDTSHGARADQRANADAALAQDPSHSMGMQKGLGLSTDKRAFSLAFPGEGQDGGAEVEDASLSWVPKLNSRK